MVLSQYLWVPIFGGICAFIASVGMGGNDVANSFATSVGAKALTLKQTIIIASICEFSGAMILGSHVTETIKGKIIVGELFMNEPLVLMYGMCTVLFGCAVWLIVSTLWSLPVSSTHTCIGGMLGMAIVSKGVKAVNWHTVINVICSWFYTPVIAGLISYTLFWIIRSTILMKEKSFAYSLNFFAPMVAFTLLINFFVVLNKGCPWLPFDFTPLQALGVSAALSVFFGIIIHFTCKPCLKRKSLRAEEELNAPLLAGEVQQPVEQQQPTVEQQQPTVEQQQPTEQVATVEQQQPTVEAVVEVPVQDVEEKKKEEGMNVFSALEKDSKVAEIHEKAERYDVKTEKIFISLQVLAAILNSFAHGANDVSHSIGPFAAVMAIYMSGSVMDTSPTPAWILAFGAVGIVLGLATMGYKVMATVGVNLVTVTPCRGFFIELAASYVVIVASGLGLPISTTQCKIGAAVGVGLVGGSEAVNWKLFAKIFGGWVITIFIAAILSAILMVIGLQILH